MFRTSFMAILAMAFAGLNTQALADNVKDWTFLIYLNGDNNLDSFGAFNINQMEQIGSTDQVNIVVQWASLSNKGSRRMLIKKDKDPKKVTSPIVLSQGVVDMGDYKSLIDFVQWGVKTYPAKHYFIDVWDHGAGWHKKMAKESGTDGGMGPIDISWDDNSGNHITTKQLGLALQASAKIIGHKVDVYGSDACLMAMPEVAAEMADSVSVFAGSEETEPGEGWPYDAILSRWTKNSKAEPADVAKILVEEYAKYYTAKQSAVTMSAFDLEKLGGLNQAVSDLGAGIKKLSAADQKKVLSAASDAQSFAYSDYVDFIDFLNKVQSQKVKGIDQQVAAANTAASSFIISNSNVKFPNSHGMTVWLPTDSYTLKEYADTYSTLNFDAATHWSDALKSFVK